MAVAGIEHRDARREIDEASAVGVPDLGILGPGDVDAFGAHAVGDGGRFTGLEICRFRHGYPPEEAYRSG